MAMPFEFTYLPILVTWLAWLETDCGGLLKEGSFETSDAFKNHILHPMKAWQPQAHKLIPLYIESFTRTQNSRLLNELSSHVEKCDFVKKMRNGPVCPIARPLPMGEHPNPAELGAQFAETMRKVKEIMDKEMMPYLVPEVKDYFAARERELEAERAKRSL